MNGMSVIGLIENSRKKYSDSVAVRTNNKNMSYAELEQESNKLANYLKKQGIADGDRVGIYMDRSEKCLIAMIAIWKVGGAYIPLDPTHPNERNEYILLHSGVEAVISYSTLCNQVKVVERCICIDSAKDEIGNQPVELEPLPVRENRTAYIIYTSGSTGRPKGVEIGQSSVVNLLMSVQKRPGMCKNDILMAITTITFDISVLELFLPLTVGACVYIADNETVKDGKWLAREMAEQKITVMQGTPTIWRMLIDSGWEGDSKLKVLCGGEALPQKLAKDLLVRSESLWNMYGPTETTIWSLVSRVKNPEHIVLGQPIENTTIAVLNDGFEKCEVGETGRLYIGGEGLFLGYFNDSEMTKEKMYQDSFGTGEWLFDTGDMVRLLGESEIEYLERADLQVKVRGFRIELEEIENAAERDEHISQAVATVWQVSEEDKRIVLFYKTNNGEAYPKNELMKKLKDRLPRYMMPSVCVELENFPLTPNNKVDRKALINFMPEENDTIKINMEDMESTITGIWSRLLFMDDILPDDDFFELGGHSLLLIQLLERIKKLYGVEISIREFLAEASTVSDMTNLICEKLEK